MAFSDHKTPVPQRGTAKPRCYYTVDNAPGEVLSRWRFAYFDDETEEALTVMPDREVTVPMCWQYYGYGSHQYTNVKYPFPYHPPYIDCKNPCGVYVTDYRRPANSGKYYLCFDGVDSCFYLFVNGREVGYSSVSHSMSEFDVTNFLEEENEIRVVVFAYHAGSYLEDQDKFRMSGIFREVYVLRRPEDHIFDYTLLASYRDGAGRLEFSCDREAEVVLSKDSEPLDRIKGKTAVFELPKVRAWSADDPVLYDVTISYNGETISETVGFRTVERKGNVLFLNGEKLIFKGVNRHSMTVNGFCETVGDLEKDLILIKKMNANAIRTSHYPPHPLLPKLCERLGIYLMEEADLECHGVCSQRNFFQWEKYVDELAESPEWTEQIVHRAMRMYERDKNRTAVLVWSLGNESGWGENFCRSALYLREKGDGRLIQYEGAWSYAKDCFQDEGLLDFKSRMYPPLGWLREFASQTDRPLVLCEYTHAMGNSCGDIADYWRIIDAFDSLCGGFVWEWCSHSVIRDGKVLYGGDFGEYPHDGNFCMDGIVTTDRIPNPEYDQVRQIYSPVRIVRSGREYTVTVGRDIKRLGGFRLNVARYCDGILLEDADHVFESHSFTVPMSERSADGDLYDRLIVTRNGDYVCGFSFPVAAARRNTGTENNAFRFSCSNGMLSSIAGERGELLASPMQVCLYRAPLDNDVEIKNEWLDYGLDRTYYFPHEIAADGSAGFLVTPYLQPVGEMRIGYGENNGLEVSASVRIAEHVKSLPRFGFVLPLKKTDCTVCWYGLGEGEVYCDKTEHALLGVYKVRCSELNYDYPKPQESGSRCGVKWLSLDFGGEKLFVDSDSDFSFCLSPYLPADYRPHRHEMKEGDTVYLYIDYKMSGVGSNSCGPRIDEKYLLTEKEFEFTFRIRSCKDEWEAYRSKK